MIGENRRKGKVFRAILVTMAMMLITTTAEAMTPPPQQGIADRAEAKIAETENIKLNEQDPEPPDGITYEKLQADKFMSHPLYKQFKPKQLTLRDKTEELQEAQVQAIDMMGGIPNPRGKLSASSIINERTVRATGYFGNGSDGALYIRAGQTVSLPVRVPHQSIVEKNYTTVTIEHGGVLTCDQPNAGLIIKVQGDCNIYGTISQKAKAPVTNPNNMYNYPPELKCGDGGNGGNNQFWSTATQGGVGMKARNYGGGYSGGGGGLVGTLGDSGPIYRGGNGGDAINLQLPLPLEGLFIGGMGAAALEQKMDAMAGVVEIVLTPLD